MDYMSEADYMRIAEAMRRAHARTAATFRNLWTYGTTHAPIAVDFCAADLLVPSVEIAS